MIGIPGEWTWLWNDPPLLHLAWAPVALLLLLLAVIFFFWQRRERLPASQAALGVALLVGLGWALQMSLGFLGKTGGQEAVDTTLTPVSSGYFTVARDLIARQETVGRFLRTYPAFLRGQKVKSPMIHVAQHPPGNILYYWALLHLCARSPGLRALGERLGRAYDIEGGNAFLARGIAATPAERATVWLAYAGLAFAAVLTVVPVFYLVRSAGEPGPGAGAEWLAAGFCLTIPSLHLFSPHMDQLHLPLTAAIGCLWALALRRDSLTLSGLTGAVTGIALFFSLHFLAVIAVCLLAAVIWCGASHWRDFGQAVSPALRLGLGFILGLGLMTGLQYLWLDYDALTTWQICLEKHSQFYLHFPRSYWKWVAMNGVEFVLFSGTAACLLSGVTIWRWFRGVRSGVKGAPVEAIVAAGLLTLVLLDFSGKNLSETARLWMFMMPLAAVGGGLALGRLSGDAWRPWLALLALQSLQLFVFKFRLNVLYTGFFGN